MGCTADPEEHPLTAEGATVIEDLKVAFMLPDGWWQNGSPVRTTYTGGFTDPEELKDNLDDLETGLNMYIHHNLPENHDSLDAETVDALFFHMLSIEVHTYHNDEALNEWGEGRCGSSEAFCDESRSQLELVRVLGPEENPFSEGTGVLYEINTAQIPVLAFVYYLVRDQWAYRIKYELTKKDLIDGTYPPLLDSIQFLN